MPTCCQIQPFCKCCRLCRRLRLILPLVLCLQLSLVQLARLGRRCAAASTTATSPSVAAARR